MDEREFFDLIYSQWAKTTGAEAQYWATEEDEKHYAGGPGTWNLYAVDQEGNRADVSTYLSEVDADFIAAMHGCLPDLVRRAHQALDEAERLDENRDERECRIAELEIENQELRYQLEEIGR